MKFYRRFLPYVVALGLTAIAVLLTLWLEPFMLRTIGAFFYIAIILTAWYGGARPGIVVVVLSTAAINYWFIPPRYQFGFERPEDVFQLSLFFLVSCLINLLTSNFRDSKQKIQQLSQKLAQENIDQRKQTQELLQQKFEQQRLVMEITQRIRQSLNLQDILQTTVDEVRDYLKTDRVIIFKFTPAWGGTIVVESVAQEWIPILPLQIYDPCIGEEYVKPFIQGLVTAKSDIYNSGISPCHIEFLAQLQVRANLVVPVMKGDQLWGLLAAHHCEAPRQWQDSEIKFLQQLAIQVSVALEQAALLEAAQTELAERKQAQIALQQREAVLRLFVQYAPAGIAMFDRDMRYLIASQHWVDEYSLESIESLINRSHYEIFPEIPERWRQIHQRCLAGAVEKCDEDLFVRLDGTRQWMWWEVHPWYTTKDEIGGIIIFAVDVSQRKQVEIALQELNASLEQRVADRTAELAKMNDHLRSSAHEIEDLYNRAPCGYHSLDGFGNVIRINDTELNWLGYGPEEIFYKPFLDLLTPESKQVFRDNFAKFKAQGWINNLEFEIINKDGTTRWISLSSTAIKDESGNYIMSRSTMFDISDRKLAEEALQQYKRIISNTKDGIALINRHYIYQIANQSYLSWCNKSAPEVIGNSVRNILGDELFDNFIQPRLDRCLAGETIQYERWFDYPNLVPQFLSVTYTPNLDTREKISGVIVSFRDLTPLKQAEQILELQAVITQNMAEGICLVRASNGVIVYTNSKFEQMFGYDSGELDGRHVSIVNYASAEVTAEDVNQAIRSAVLQGGEYTYEVHNVKKDGTPFWCSATASVFDHPDYGDVLVAIHQDITVAKHLEDVRQRTEEALRRSEAKFRSLSESSPIGIFMTDIQGYCIYTNPHYQQICGCTFDQALGEGWSQFIHPEDREQVTAQWSEAVSQGQEFSSEIRYVREDGTIRFGRVRSAPIFSITDELIGYVGTVEDVTERRAIETMKSEFISIVSHELRTPLSSIRGSLGLLAAGVFKNKPETAQQMLDIAIHDTERLVRLVNDILDLERLDAQKVNLVKQWYDGVILLKQSVETVQSLAAESQIQLSVEPNSVEVFVDRDRIIQTLVNLISNAIKFSPPETTVTLSIQDQADQILFEVKDQGRGIPADQLETIFGRFQQVDASDSRQKGGTGLGLAISKSIVQQHGGKLWVESIVGEGSSFYFTLPKLLD